MTVIQLQVPMSAWNSELADTSASMTAVRLQMSRQSFAVLCAAGPVLIRCLTGWVWITQEANRNDTVLDASQECRLAGAQKIYLNAWDGALLAISDALDGSAPPRFRRRAKNLRIKITRGTYTLSGVGTQR